MSIFSVRRLFGAIWIVSCFLKVAPLWAVDGDDSRCNDVLKAGAGMRREIAQALASLGQEFQRSAQAPDQDAEELRIFRAFSRLLGQGMSARRIAFLRKDFVKKRNFRSPTMIAMAVLASDDATEPELAMVALLEGASLGEKIRALQRLRDLRALSQESAAGEHAEVSYPYTRQDPFRLVEEILLAGGVSADLKDAAAKALGYVDTAHFQELEANLDVAQEALASVGKTASLESLSPEAWSRIEKAHLYLPSRRTAKRLIREISLAFGSLEAKKGHLSMRAKLLAPLLAFCESLDPKVSRTARAALKWVPDPFSGLYAMIDAMRSEDRGDDAGLFQKIMAELDRLSEMKTVFSKNQSRFLKDEVERFEKWGDELAREAKIAPLLMQKISKLRKDLKA